MGSYELQAERISALREFNHRNKTNFNKRDTVIHEIQKHRENQSASIKFRQTVLESQKRSNYKNEYDILKGTLSNGLVKEQSKQYINERMGRLKDLVSQSIKGVNHDIYKPKTIEEKTETENLNDINSKLKKIKKTPYSSDPYSNTSGSNFKHLSIKLNIYQ